MTKLTTEPRDIFVRAVDLEALGISISYVMTDDPARLAECKRNAQTIADALSTAAPAFEAKHISLTQKDAKLLLTLEIDAVEGAPAYLVTPINPAAVRSSVSENGALYTMDQMRGYALAFHESRASAPQAALSDDQRATLLRLAMILEAGQAENGIDNARAAHYAEALQALLTQAPTERMSEAAREGGEA